MLSIPRVASKTFIRILLIATAIAVSSTPAYSAERILKIQELTCHTTETITGPDKVYIRVIDEAGGILWDSSAGKSTAKELNDDQSWKVDHSINLGSGRGATIVVFDSDGGAVVDANAFADSFKRSIEEDNTLSGGQVYTAGIGDAVVIAAIFAAVQSAIDLLPADDDDLLTVAVVNQRDTGSWTVRHKKDGLAILAGKNFDYELKFSVVEAE